MDFKNCSIYTIILFYKVIYHWSFVFSKVNVRKSVIFCLLKRISHFTHVHVILLCSFVYWGIRRIICHSTGIILLHVIYIASVNRRISQSILFSFQVEHAVQQQSFRTENYQASWIFLISFYKAIEIDIIIALKVKIQVGGYFYFLYSLQLLNKHCTRAEETLAEYFVVFSFS